MHFKIWLESVSDKASVVAILAGDCIVVGKRKSEPEKGKWGLIGGYVEEGESPEEAAIREAKEETGLELSKVNFLKKKGNVHYFYSYIDKVDLRAGSDIGEVKWVNNVKNLAFDGEEIVHEIQALVS